MHYYTLENIDNLIDTNIVDNFCLKGHLSLITDCPVGNQLKEILDEFGKYNTPMWSLHISNNMFKILYAYIRYLDENPNDVNAKKIRNKIIKNAAYDHKNFANFGRASHKDYILRVFNNYSVLQNTAKNTDAMIGLVRKYITSMENGKILEGFLESGLDPNMVIERNKNKKIIHLCCYYLTNIEYLKLLIKYQVDVNAKDIEGNTPLHILSKSKRSSDITEQFITELILAGADSNIYNNEGDTPLHVSILNRSESVQVLLEKGCDINCPKSDSKFFRWFGVTPLKLSYMIGNKKAINMLSNRGANRYLGKSAWGIFYTIVPSIPIWQILFLILELFWKDS